MTTHAKREKISAVDTAWLRMDRPGNLMMICGVLFFRERVDFRRLRAVIEERLLQFDRFRQRPVQTPPARSGKPTGTSTSTIMSSMSRCRGRAARRSCRRS